MIIGTWSTVHGFAHLALDGKFDEVGSIEDTLANVLSTLLPPSS
jgi:hypothetical protein